MPLTAGRIMLRTLIGGQSFGKAATSDIQWHEPAGDGPMLTAGEG